MSKVKSARHLNQGSKSRRKDQAENQVERHATAGTPPSGRPKSARRRHIDPTTCEREYSADERDFMTALERYKRTSGRMFPTCSEVLEVIHALGYRRLRETDLTPAPPAGDPVEIS